MEPILEVKNLIKTFGQFIAVNNISFNVNEGEILGLLGPNGAGKTTTISILLDLMTPDSGSISYFGKEFPKYRQYCFERINYASAYSRVQAKMTVGENLKVYAGLFGMRNPEKRISELLDLLEIGGIANTLFWRLSAGQKTRVVLVKALLNKPKLILMDEPTASLDPDIAAKVVDLIQLSRKEENVSILYTSHDMKEVEQLCDRVIFLDHGKIVAQDSVSGLTAHIRDSVLRLTINSPMDKVTGFLSTKQFSFVNPKQHTIEISLPEKEIPPLLFSLNNEEIVINNIEIDKPNLEDVFFSIVKGKYEHTKN